MLEINNLSYTFQNQSSVTILKHFIQRWQMNITAEIKDLTICIVVNGAKISKLRCDLDLDQTMPNVELV